jgi:type IV secretory pathway VirB2 component (pilin)
VAVAQGQFKAEVQQRQVQQILAVVVAVVAQQAVVLAVVVLSSLTQAGSLHLRLVHQLCRELFILLLLVERLHSKIGEYLWHITHF